jgi:hypothetical protein
MLSRVARGRRIDFVQVTQNGLDRGVQAVKIETVETALQFAFLLPFIVSAQPADELKHIGIAPHPLWKTPEAA